jgi:hypothetical protein
LLIYKSLAVPSFALDMDELGREAAYLVRHVIILNLVVDLDLVIQSNDWRRELEDKFKPIS